MGNEHRKCAECGDKLVGRADQKFCSDNCRNAFNNRQNSDANNLVRNINNTLRRNRRILHDLNPSEKAKTNRDKLLQKGKKISNNEGLTDHYRRFVDVSDFKNKLNKLNFKIIYLKQSINLSKYKNDNPHLCRVVFKNVK